MVRCDSKNGHQKGIMSLGEIGLCDQKFVNHSRLNSQHNKGARITALGSLDFQNSQQTHGCSEFFSDCC